MSSDVFVIRENPFSLMELRSAYECVGASFSGDLEHACVEGGFGRFYLNAGSTQAEFSPWQYFEKARRSQVLAIVGEPKWLLTITSSGSLDGVNFAIVNLPHDGPAAVENDNGAVFTLEAAQQSARLGTEWQSQEESK